MTQDEIDAHVEEARQLARERTMEQLLAERTPEEIDQIKRFICSMYLVSVERRTLH